MVFPPWVDSPRKSKTDRARARLKFMLSQVAFNKTGKASIRQLAPLVGLDYSTLYLYIKRGKFTLSTALLIQHHLGSDVMPATHLTNPLDITPA